MNVQSPQVKNDTSTGRKRETPKTEDKSESKRSISPQNTGEVPAEFQTDRFKTKLHLFPQNMEELPVEFRNQLDRCNAEFRAEMDACGIQVMDELSTSTASSCAGGGRCYSTKDNKELMKTFAGKHANIHINPRREEKERLGFWAVPGLEPNPGEEIMKAIIRKEAAAQDEWNRKEKARLDQIRDIEHAELVSEIVQRAVARGEYRERAVTYKKSLFEIRKKDPNFNMEEIQFQPLPDYTVQIPSITTPGHVMLTNRVMTKAEKEKYMIRPDVIKAAVSKWNACSRAFLVEANDDPFETKQKNNRNNRAKGTARVEHPQKKTSKRARCKCCGKIGKTPAIYCQCKWQKFIRTVDQLSSDSESDNESDPNETSGNCGWTTVSADKRLGINYLRKTDQPVSGNKNDDGSASGSRNDDGSVPEIS